LSAVSARLPVLAVADIPADFVLVVVLVLVIAFLRATFEDEDDPVSVF
jgi:hypothetical protein